MIGELAALMCSVCWAIASFIFRLSVDNSSPYLLNLLKCGYAILILGFFLPFQSDAFPSIPCKNYIQLIASGIIGLGVGDTLYFFILSALGTRKTLLMETLAPPLTGILSYLYYGTGINLMSWVGMGFTIAGIIIVLDK